MATKSYTTLYEAIKKFNDLHQDKPQVISAINRYLLPSFGLEIAGLRLTKAEQENAAKIAQEINVQKYSEENLLNRVNDTFKKNQLSKSKQRYPLSHIKNFNKFLKENNILNPELESINSPPKYYLKSTKVIDKSYIEYPKNKKRKKTIILSLNTHNYEKQIQEKGEKIVKKELKRISLELNNLNKFMTDDLNNRKVSASKTVQEIKRLLGWLFLEKDDLSKVGLCSLIKVIDTRVNYFDFDKINDYYINKGKLDHEARQASIKTIDWLKNFFYEYGVPNPSTRIIYINALLYIAKFLYKDITDTEETDNYEDIHIVRRLRLLKRNLPKPDKKIKDLYFTWEEILKVRDALKANADTTYITYKLWNGQRIKKQKRSKVVIAADLMKFLILCFFTVIPPDRSRTITELTIGKTLKHGLKTENGFIKYEKLNDKTLAKYYIHLQSKDYKTGDAYGEFWGVLPNIAFADKTTFYNYLDKWLYEGWRQVLLEVKGLDHDSVLVGIKSSKAFKDMKGRVGNTIKWIFKTKTGIPLNPHRLRHIFRSHVDNLDITPKESESIAFWMHHSELMAKNVYTIKSLEQKLSPGLEIMERITNT